jgi:hypothetical protein
LAKTCRRVSVLLACHVTLSKEAPAPRIKRISPLSLSLLSLPSLVSLQ